MKIQNSYIESFKTICTKTKKMSDKENKAQNNQLEDDGISPFLPPNDEEVFVTRETEK